MSHTPGPWEVDDENQICAGNRVIASTKYLGMGECDENARLIAAAPDLLAALIKADHCLRKSHYIGIERDEIQAAIKKAKGE